MQRSKSTVLALILMAALVAGCGRGQVRRVIEPGKTTNSASTAAPVPTGENLLLPTAGIIASPSNAAAQPNTLAGAPTPDVQIDQTLGQLDQQLNDIQKSLDSTDTMDDFK